MSSGIHSPRICWKMATTPSTCGLGRCQDRSRAAGPQGCHHHPGLHARAKPRPQGRAQPVGLGDPRCSSGKDVVWPTTCPIDTVRVYHLLLRVAIRNFRQRWRIPTCAPCRRDAYPLWSLVSPLLHPIADIPTLILAPRRRVRLKLEAEINGAPPSTGLRTCFDYGPQSAANLHTIQSYQDARAPKLRHTPPATAALVSGQVRCIRGAK